MKKRVIRKIVLKTVNNLLSQYGDKLIKCVLVGGTVVASVLGIKTF